jgi:DHA2 family multidrug resistance protein
MTAASAQIGPGAVAWHPRTNPWLIASAVMLTTFMVVLDSTVVNVALPHIAGSMSASVEEATWTLTSFLVAMAIVLPATGWLGSLLGRKRLLLACVVVFTLASVACGAAQSLGFLIVARVIQGLGGGAMQPISQAVLLESFPPKKRGVAMAVFGLGVVVAPIIGPTLGGWITDNYSWRWIFYINIPIGLMAVSLIKAFLEDPPYIRTARPGRLDLFGLVVLAIWVGSLHVALDKGQQEDWLSSPLIGALLAMAAVGFIVFIFWEWHARHPVVDLHILRDRNFSVGTGLITVVGAVLYGSTALLPLFLQTLLGYTALKSGLTVSPRGVGSLVAMFMVGRLIGLIDGRALLVGGVYRPGLLHVRAGQPGPPDRPLQRRLAEHPDGAVAGVHLRAPDNQRHGHAAQRADGQCNRHLQSHAQYRRRRRHRADDHDAGPRRPGAPDHHGGPCHTV